MQLERPTKFEHMRLPADALVERLATIEERFTQVETLLDSFATRHLSQAMPKRFESIFFHPFDSVRKVDVTTRVSSTGELAVTSVPVSISMTTQETQQHSHSLQQSIV